MAALFTRIIHHEGARRVPSWGTDLRCNRKRVVTDISVRRDGFGKTEIVAAGHKEVSFKRGHKEVLGCSDLFY